MSNMLEGKVAVVTGGSKGIGLAIAAALVSEGASVAITGRNEEQLTAARRRLESSAAGRVDAYAADVRDPAAADRTIAAASDRFGGLDVLVNNAGIGLFARVADMTPSQWADTIDTNLTGVFHACRAMIPRLRARGGGAIVNISSLASTNPFVGGAAYCASKAALNAFSEALMQELRYDNIRVSCVLPGSVATGFGGDASKGADWKARPEDVAEVVVDILRLPVRSLLGRVELRPSKPAK